MKKMACQTTRTSPWSSWILRTRWTQPEWRRSGFFQHLNGPSLDILEGFLGQFPRHFLRSSNLKSVIMNTASIKESYSICLTAIAEGSNSHKMIGSPFEDLNECMAQFCAQCNFHGTTPARTCSHRTCIRCWIFSGIPQDPVRHRISCPSTQAL